MTTKPSTKQAGVLTDAEVKVLWLRSNYFVRDFASAIEAEVIRKLASQRPSEHEGLLKEAEELLSRFAYSNRPYGSPNYSASMADLIKRLAAALRAQGAGEPVASDMVMDERCPRCKSNKVCQHCDHCGENWG